MIEILLIEGDYSSAALIAEMLSEGEQTFTVRHALNLAEGLSLLQKRSFDAALVDIGAPDGGGLETALTVRDQANSMPLLVMASLYDENVALKALESDIQDYVVKGEVTGIQLKRTIRHAIQRKHYMEARRQYDAEAHQRCEQRFASFMRHLPAAAWAKDPMGRYVFGNTEHERIFSMPFSEYAGKRDEEFLPLETARQLRENDEWVLAEGQSLQTIEVLRQADGIERHFIVNKFPIPGPDGQPTDVAGIGLDITERVRTEEALQKSEKKFAKVFHGAPALLAVSTLEEGRFVDVNDTMLRTLRYRREEIIGRTALELGLWDDLADRDTILRALEEKESAKDIEVRLRGKSGTSLVGLFSAEYIYVNGDRYMLSLIKDITDIKLVREQVERMNTELAARANDLEEANQELEAFNYTVAHDLRNPLNVISGYCQVIEQVCGNKLDEKCRGYLQHAYGSTVRMNLLITDLLNFSRMARTDLHREAFDISVMAQEVAIQLKQIEPERCVIFKIADGIMVDGDPSLLRIVLDNILGNAWKYTGIRDEAMVEFGVTEIGGEAVCYVRDNGPGFDMAEAGKLFLPFQRLNDTVELKGIGVGLATVERIIRRHGGRVWAEGEPGKGATFYFSLGDRENSTG